MTVIRSFLFNQLQSYRKQKEKKMGGDYYEREVFAAPVNANANQQQSACTIPPKPYSDQAKATLTQKGLHKSNDPKRFAEDERKLKSTHKHPIVFALDVSGSRGDWPMVTKR